MVGSCKMRETTSRSKKSKLSVYDIQASIKESQQGGTLRVTFAMPFNETKIFRLIFASGLRAAAATMSVRASPLYTALVDQERDLNKTDSKLIDQEIFFFAGVSMGGLVSVFLFLTVFQRKQYLLIVCLNSIYVLWNASMYMFAFLDIKYGGS